MIARTALRLLLVPLCVICWLAFVQVAAAQIAVSGGRGPESVPHQGYFSGFGSYYDGDFVDAGRDFRDAGRSGIASTEGRWIDSICYYTMMGECYYQMGKMGDALDQYTAALKLYLANRDWMLRVDFSAATIEPEQNLNKTITWGSSSRKTILGHFPDRFQSLQGRLDNDQVIQKGGVVAPPQLFPVYVSEIVRCTCVSLSRRREIMGPACEYDPTTIALVDALARRPGPPNHWAQCWVELELGLAYASANKIPQAASELSKSLLAGGQYDHPLTCVGLLELGKLAFEQGKYDSAITFFHEATISAVYFNRYEVMEEGFRLGALAHTVSGQKGIYPPLVPAAAASKRVPMVQTSILAALAEQLCSAGDLSDAASTIGQARGNLNRRDMALGAIGSRVNYQASRIALQSGDVRTGGSALATALTYQKGSSKRLFQIALADRLFTTGEVTERVADLLFTEVLREPLRTDWVLDPLDTLSIGLSAHPQPYEHWFELSLARKEQDKALNIGDRIRRHRYYATQPLGGRLLALRWVLEAPKEVLSDEALLQRQDLLVKYPKFAELSQQAKAVRDQLQALPLAPTEEADTKQQAALLAELGKLSAAQESILQVIALERVPSEFAFPPLRDTKDVQKQIPEGTLVFYYLATSRNVHAFAISNQRYGYFTVAQPAKVRADIGELLKSMGHHDRTQPLDAGDLKDEAWKTPADRLLGQLTNQTKPEEWAKYKELVIVPDSVLWYLPFEALPVKVGEATRPLISQVAIRYAPTLSLAMPDKRGLRPVPRTAIVSGKLLPRETDQAAAQERDQVAEAVPGAVILSEQPPATSSIFGATFDRLVVLADMEDPDRLPFGWSPLKLDAGKPGSTLSDWGLLPWAGVEQVVLPGFHTPAEYGLKKGGTGDEIFLSVCGLMASGSRTVLLSRWRVGGQSTANLMREFVQELPHEPAAAAWRRSVQLCSENLLDPAAEGRLKGSGTDGLKADHPFFWSGYLLVDTGLTPPKDAAAAPVAAAPVAAAVAPAKPAAPAAAPPAEKAPAEKVPAEKAPADKPAPKPAAEKPAVR
jgi:CHAT domain-containing protein